MSSPDSSARFDVVRIRIGAATAPLLDDDRLEFYRAVIRALTGVAGSFVGTDQDWRCITTETANENAKEVRAVVREALVNASEDASQLLLDLTLASLDASTSHIHLRGAVNLIIAQELNEFLRSNEGRVLQRIMVLLPELPPEQDLVRIVLSHAVRTGRVILVADNGDTAPAVDEDRRGAYKSVIASERGNDLDVLRARLVRRKGWFSRGERGYVRYFYELSGARDELHHELTRRLSDLPPGARILSNSGISRWLEEPLNSAALQVLGPTSPDVLHFTNLVELEEGLLESEPSHVAVVVPMVDTSKTIKQIRDKLTTMFPGTPLSFLSVLSSQGQSEVDGSRSMAGGVDLAYLLRVDQIHVSNTAHECDAEHLGFQDPLADEDRGGPLRPYQYWDLVRDATPVGERNPPDWRPSGRALMPDFESMMVKHGYGPWLALRLWHMFDGQVSAVPRDTLFVCPEGEANSDTLADFMRRTIGVRIVRIPRTVIDPIKKARFDRTVARKMWESTDGPWKTLLRSSGQSDVVIMDDIVVTSSSISAIRAILEIGGFLVTGVACLVDFSMDANPEVRALYSYPRADLVAEGGA